MHIHHQTQAEWRLKSIATGAKLIWLRYELRSTTGHFDLFSTFSEFPETRDRLSSTTRYMMIDGSRQSTHPVLSWQISCASRKAENSRWKCEILRKFLAGKSRVLRIRSLVGPNATISFKFILACNYVFATIASPLLVCFLINWIFYQSFHIFSGQSRWFMSCWWIFVKFYGLLLARLAVDVKHSFCFEKIDKLHETCTQPQTMIISVGKCRLPLHHKLARNKNGRWQSPGR